MAAREREYGLVEDPAQDLSAEGDPVEQEYDPAEEVIPRYGLYTGPVSPAQRQPVRTLCRDNLGQRPGGFIR